MRAFRVVMSTIWDRHEGRFCVIVLGLWVGVSLLALIWTPQPLSRTDGFHVWQSPSWVHPLGTDGTGADMLSWLMAGSAVDLLIAVLTITVAAAIGLLLVAAMVSRHTLLSQTTVVIVDALISLPTVLLALILAVPLGAGIGVIVAACGFGYGLNLARIARPQALLATRSEYVESALANGESPQRVFLTHVIPNILPVLAVQLSICAGTVILAESGLTYLGIGVPATTPSWGHSIATSVSFINVYPLTVLWPGLVVTLVVTALNVFGDVLRTSIDPVANPALRDIQGPMSLGVASLRNRLSTGRRGRGPRE